MQAELRTKTVLEHLIFHGKKNAIGVCRELSISPQQFTDWIKGRRPIPADRLALLGAYFSVPQYVIADERRYARELTTAISMELEISALRAVRANSASEQEQMDFRLGELQREMRLLKMTERFKRILGRADENGLVRMDELLSKWEQESGI